MRKLAIVLLATSGVVAPAACGARTDIADVAATKPLTPGDVAEVVVLYASCLPDVPLPAAAAGIFKPDDISQKSAVDCAAREHALGCRAIADCFGDESIASPDCAPGCDGAILTLCSGGVAVTRDCSKLGLACAGDKCVRPSGGPCDPTTFVAACNGGVPQNCEADGTIREEDECASLGLVCNPDPVPFADPPIAVCTGEGASCLDPLTSIDDALASQALRCDGDHIVLCVNAHEAAVDCGAFVDGATCRALESNPSNAYCGFGASCVGTAPTCDGTSVVFCDGGVAANVDCTTIGFTTCESGLCVGATP